LLRFAPEKIVQRGIALVPEGRRVFTKLTVEENLLVGSTIRGDRRSAERTMQDVLERFPALARYLDVPAGRLSGGEQQQLAIGRALMCQPRILLLDEPSLGLAPLIIEKLFATLTELNRSSVTILLVEQNALQALDLAHRAYVLDRGEVRVEGPPDIIRNMPDFAETYVGIGTKEVDRVATGPHRPPKADDD
jgi:branched-chain amino acid transport system ATP-binding protein